MRRSCSNLQRSTGCVRGSFSKRTKDMQVCPGAKTGEVSGFLAPHKRSSPTTFAAEPLRPLDYLRSVVAVTAITVTAIRIAADVYPAVIGHPLHARIVT